MIELFSRVETPAVFATTAGIHDLPAYFRKLEKELLRVVAEGALGESVDPNQIDVEEFLFEDKLFRELVVQRSRAYVRASQEQQGGKEVIFPDKQPPVVIPYSVKKTYGDLLGKLETAFTGDKHLFSFALYYPLAYWNPAKIPIYDANRQKQLVRLIRILFLKRFESSIFAFD